MVSMTPEHLTALSGLIVGVLGLILGWRKAHVTARDSALGVAVQTYHQMTESLRLEVAALRTEVASLYEENHKLRNAVTKLTMELALARRGLDPEDM